VVRLEPDAETGKIKKVPYQSKNPKDKAYVNVPGSWSTYQEALDAANNSPDELGIGVFTGEFAEHPGQYLSFIDIDHFEDDFSGEKANTGAVLWNMTYCEQSQSGTGGHALLVSSIATGVRVGQMEAYSKDRLCMLTGWSNGLNVEVRDTEFRAFVDFLRGKQAAKSAHRERFEETDEDPWNDDEIFDHMRKARNWSEIDYRLNCGAEDPAGYPSCSERDIANMNVISFHINCVNKAVSRSQLMRMFESLPNFRPDKYTNRSKRMKSIEKAMERNDSIGEFANLGEAMEIPDFFHVAPEQVQEVAPVPEHPAPVGNATGKKLVWIAGEYRDMSPFMVKEEEINRVRAIAAQFVTKRGNMPKLPEYYRPFETQFFEVHPQLKGTLYHELINMIATTAFVVNDQFFAFSIHPLMGLISGRGITVERMGLNGIYIAAAPPGAGKSIISLMPERLVTAAVNASKVGTVSNDPSNYLSDKCFRTTNLTGAASIFRPFADSKSKSVILVGQDGAGDIAKMMERPDSMALETRSVILNSYNMADIGGLFGGLNRSNNKENGIDAIKRPNITLDYEMVLEDFVRYCGPNFVKCGMASRSVVLSDPNDSQENEFPIESLDDAENKAVLLKLFNFMSMTFKDSEDDSVKLDLRLSHDAKNLVKDFTRTIYREYGVNSFMKDAMKRITSNVKRLAAHVCLLASFDGDIMGFKTKPIQIEAVHVLQVIPFISGSVNTFYSIVEQGLHIGDAATKSQAGAEVDHNLEMLAEKVKDLLTGKLKPTGNYAKHFELYRSLKVIPKGAVRAACMKCSPFKNDEKIFEHAWSLLASRDGFLIEHRDIKIGDTPKRVEIVTTDS
jgi:hypothetical protein